MTTAENTTETVTTYTARWTRDCYSGSNESHETNEAACERAQSYIDAHEPSHLSVLVRPARDGGDAGIYLGSYRPGATALREVPEEVRELLDRAWEHACATWPR